MSIDPWNKEIFHYDSDISQRYCCTILREHSRKNKKKLLKQNRNKENKGNSLLCEMSLSWWNISYNKYRQINKYRHCVKPGVVHMFEIYHRYNYNTDLRNTTSIYKIESL